MLIGAKSLASSEALTCLGRLLRHDSPQLSVARIEWPLLARLSPSVSRLPLYRPVVGTRADRPIGSVRPLLLAVGEEEQQPILEEFLIEQIASVLGCEASSVAGTIPVTQLGLDSLMSVELLNRIEAELGIVFPMGALFGGPTIQQLAGQILPILREGASFTPSKDATMPVDVV